MATQEAAEDEYSPEDIRATFQKVVEWQHRNDSEKTPFAELLTPRARVQIIDALLGANEDLTASEVCDMAGIDRSTFHAHEDFLLTTGLVERPKKKGNAWVYRLNPHHPVVQLLTMADVVFRHGETPMLLEGQFVGEPGADYEPGDHPKDPR